MAAQPVESVHVINLDDDKERLVRFREVNSHLPIVRQSAANGASLDSAQLRGQGYIGKNLSYDDSILGHALSHIRLWRRAVEGQTSITVAEDHTIFARDFMTSANAFLARLPHDWDIVTWGWNFRTFLWVEMPEGVGVSLCKLETRQDELRRNIDAFRTGHYTPTPIRLRHCFGPMAYTISADGAAKLLNCCLPLRDQLILFPGFDVVTENISIDAMMNSVYPAIRAYVSVPPLAVSAGSGQDDFTYHPSHNIRAAVSQNCSLAVCFPVWNRADLFEACYRSLLRQIEGLEASIWIFDNGSDALTRSLIGSLDSRSHRLFKIYLPENMGINYVANIFPGMLQSCDFVGLRAPSHILFADADMYFKRPVVDLINILESDSDVGVVSGHDSVEHPVLREYNTPLLPGVTIKEKSNERGACLILRRERFSACVPFPHDFPRSMDWQLLCAHPHSIAARGLKVLAVDAAIHLGLYESTWSGDVIPADPTQVDEVNDLLKSEGLLTEERRERMHNYCRRFSC